MTRKILLVTQNKELADYVKISALTLTKLNVQVELVITDNTDEIEKHSSDQNLDSIFLDLDYTVKSPLEIIRDVRTNESSKTKKIVGFHSAEINREEVFSAGCDSIMKTDEFKRIAAHLLQF